AHASPPTTMRRRTRRRRRVLAVLATLVAGVFREEHAPPLDPAHLAPVRPDGRADVHDVAEALIVLDHRARLLGVVDDRHQAELRDLVALERRALLARVRRDSRAPPPERIAPPGRT